MIQRSRAKGPLSIKSTKRVTDPVDGTHHEVTLSDGTTVTMYRDTDQFGPSNPQWYADDPLGTDAPMRHGTGSLGHTLEIAKGNLIDQIEADRTRTLEKAGVTAVVPPPPAPENIPPAAPEDRARAEFRGDVTKAVGDEYGSTQAISGFQKQALDVLHDRNMSTPLLQLALNQAKDDFENAKNTADVGKVETDGRPDPEKAADALLTSTLQRVKRLEAEAKAQDANAKTSLPPESFTEPETNALGELKSEEKATVADHYGTKTFDDVAKRSLLKDVAKGVANGWQTVHAKIREIAQKVAGAMMAVSLIFNPAGVQGVHLATHSTARVEAAHEKLATVPTNIAAQASKGMARAYQVVMPQFLAGNISEKGKGIVFIDKPNGHAYFFDSQGKLYYQDAVLVGQDLGDLLHSTGKPGDMSGTKEQVAGHKITPAGVFRAERQQYWNDYTTGNIFKLQGADTSSSLIAIHAVWEGAPKEKRDQRLASKDPAQSRISNGCINTRTQGFIDEVLPHAAELDGAPVVIVPDAQERVDAFLAGDVKDEATRVSVKPLTEKTKGEPTREPSAPAQPANEALPAGERERILQASRRASGRGRDSGRSNTPHQDDQFNPTKPEKLSASEFEDYWDRRFAAESELREQLDQMGLHDIAGRVITRAEMAIKHGEIDTPPGTYSSTFKLVELALEGTDKRRTGFHEAGHALRDLDLVEPHEWELMRAYAEKIGTLKEMQDAKPGAEKGTHEEEAIVEAYARWASGIETHPPEGVAALFERLTRFLRAIASSFTGHDFSTAEDIFRKMYTGEIGARERGVERMGARTYGGGGIRDDVFERTQAQAKAAHNSPQSKARRTSTEKVGAWLNTNAKVWGLKGSLYWTQTEDIANIMRSRGMGSARRVVDLHSAAHAMGREFEEKTIKIMEAWKKLSSKEKGNRPGSVNRMMYDMVRSGKWGFEPKHLSAAEKAEAKYDPKLREQFDAMPPEAQEVLRDVFEHGYKANRELEKGVRSQIDADYKGGDRRGQDRQAAKRRHREAQGTRASPHAAVVRYPGVASPTPRSSGQGGGPWSARARISRPPRRRGIRSASTSSSATRTTTSSTSATTSGRPSCWPSTSRRSSAARAPTSSSAARSRAARSTRTPSSWRWTS